jgi:hypothetical protein
LVLAQVAYRQFVLAQDAYRQCGVVSRLAQRQRLVLLSQLAPQEPPEAVRFLMIDLWPRFRALLVRSGCTPAQAAKCRAANSPVFN